MTGWACTCFHLCFLLGLFLNLEDGGRIVLRISDWLPTDCTKVYPRRLNTSQSPLWEFEILNRSNTLKFTFVTNELQIQSEQCLKWTDVCFIGVELGLEPALNEDNIRYLCSREEQDRTLYHKKVEGTENLICHTNKQTPWPLVRKRTIPTERPPLLGEI
jgi:hypothetical protein